MTYTLPSVSLLSLPSDTDTHTTIASLDRVEEALSSAGLAVEGVTVRFAPQVIRYLVKLAPGADPKKAERAIDRVELAVGAPVRYAGVHEGHVIIEQNRTQADIVNLRSVIESSEALIRLGVPLGVAATGEPLIARLADMPHMLVAGTTGAGKSAFLTSALTALLLRNSPDDLRLTLIDPKRVELAAFADAPHVQEIVTDVGAAGVVLRRLAQLMDRRYEVFKLAGVKSFEEYNDKQPPGAPRMARQVLVVDELADLIITSKVCEPTLVRLAQLGRAAGLHLLLATQHPAANVLTAQLRLNIPARVVFAVQSHVASKVALDYTGAEKLRGHGDGLFKAPRVGEPVRFQAPLVSADDVARVVAAWRMQEPVHEVAQEPRPQPVEEPVDDGAELRAAADAWLDEAAADVDSAVASLTPEEILGDAGFSPLVIQAFATVMTDKIVAGVEERLTSMLSSSPVNTTEGDRS